MGGTQAVAGRAGIGLAGASRAGARGSLGERIGAGLRALVARWVAAVALLAPSVRDK